MKKQEEKKHLNKLWKKMQQHFKSFTQTQAPEELHQFRVQIKKIRSFLTLLEGDKKNNRLLEKFKPVKKIFTAAGVIRDALLHQKQGKEHKLTLSDFYKEQAVLQEQETKKLVSKSAKHLHKMKEVKKGLQKRLHPLSANDIKAFYKTKLDTTHQLLTPRNFGEELHEGRKILKHLMYNQQAVKDDLAKELNINFEYIDELQDLLGEWHDNILALTFFQKKLSAKDLQLMKKKNRQLEKSITRQVSGFEKKITADSHSQPTK